MICYSLGRLMWVKTVFLLLSSVLERFSLFQGAFINQLFRNVRNNVLGWRIESCGLGTCVACSWPGFHTLCPIWTPEPYQEWSLVEEWGGSPHSAFQKASKNSNNVSIPDYFYKFLLAFWVRLGIQYDNVHTFIYFEASCVSLYLSFAILSKVFPHM